MKEERLKIVTIDCETTIDPVHGPAPQLKSNRAVYIGRKIERSNRPSLYYSGSNITLPSDVHIIQGHNLKFDLLYLIKKQPMLLKDLALSGALLWDTQLVAYLLSGQQDKSISLDELSNSYGLALKEDKIKEYFKLGIGADQIDPDEILPYLEQDVEVTSSIASLQRESIEENNPEIMPLITSQGDALLAITEMEKNGLQIDTLLLEKLYYENNQKLTTLEVDLIASIMSIRQSLFPTDINLNSPTFLSAFLFGGTIKVDRTEVVMDSTGQPVIYKTGKRKGLQKTRKVIKEIKLSPIFNGDTYSTKTSSGKQYQVNEEVLNKIVNTSTTTVGMLKFISQLLEYKSVHKEQSTYIEGIRDILFPDGRVYGSINQTITTTGRTSSSKPNLQNITSKDDSNIKKLFVSRYGDSGRIVEVDYKQLEVIALALLSNDRQLIADIMTGRDIHNETGREVFTLPMTHDQRRQVKAANFAIIYGGSAKTLVKQAGIEPTLAKQLVAAFYKRYPGVQSWQQSYASVVNHADKDLEGVTDSGWPRHIVSMSTDTKRMLVYKEYDNPWGGVSYSPTEMKNYPVQSLATGDIVPLMIGILFRELCKAGLYDTVHLVNTVHDSIILDVHIDSLKEAVGLCKSVLENVPRYLEEVFDIKTTLPFKVEITAGKNWKEQEDIDKVI